MVNDHEIKRDEVEKYYRSAAASQTTPPSDEESLSLKLNILDELINNEILLQLAQKQNLLGHRRRSRRQVHRGQEPLHRGRISAATEGSRRLPWTTSSRISAGTLSIQKLINREVVNKITITDQDVADFYNQNRAQFNVAETQYRIAQIVVTPRKDPQIRNRKNDDATTDTEAQTQNRRACPTASTTAQISRSWPWTIPRIPTTASTGGDLGYIPESSLDKSDPALKKAVL